MKNLTAHGVQLTVMGLVATAFVFFPVVAMSLGVAPEAIENRALAPAPAARDGWNALDAVSPWATDHLPGRANAVHLNAWLDYNVLGQLPARQEGDAGGAAETPPVIRGKDGYLFYGPDFTLACDQTAKFEQALTSLTKFAEIVASSGRRVVFSVAPNKSSVATDMLPRAVPRGDCAANGIAQQNRLLDTMQHPLWVGIRKPLADAQASGKPVFLRTDTHWTLLGGAIYAQAVAAHLDPELARRLRLKPERMPRAGDMFALIGLTPSESVMSASVSSGATVLPDPKKAATDDRLRPIYQPDSWVTRPGKGLVQGRTLLLGDSFTSVAALTSLRPLFAQGRYVSFNHAPASQVISEIRASDTVVIEVVQRTVVGHLFTQRRLQKRVAAALGVPAG
jgi:alginate O-acetyltransferase complex protein AlgJ